MAKRRVAKMPSLVARAMITEGKCHSRQVPDQKKLASKNACRKWRMT